MTIYHNHNLRNIFSNPALETLPNPKIISYKTPSDESIHGLNPPQILTDFLEDATAFKVFLAEISSK